MVNRTIPRCPHCGAALNRKIGAALPPLKQHILDTIRATGEMGITSRDLMATVYHPSRKQPKIAVIRNHIFQINELLVDTEWKIVTHDRRHWMMVRQPRF